MNHKGTKTIETERLLLRKFREDDAEAAYRNWTSDDKVTEFLRWPTHADLAVTESVLRSWAEESEKPDFYQWAIVLKELGEPVGTISVVEKNDELNLLQIGYCIGSRWWHRGITSEAFSAVIPYLFREVGANRIEAMHDPNNPHSGDVMKKCGLKYEGTLRQADVSNRGVVDASVYSILRDEWEAAQPREAAEAAGERPQPTDGAPLLFPFGQELHPLVQEDQSPKKVFVLGVYASAVHARWKKDGKVLAQALAVASEPRIFWDGNAEEAAEIIRRCRIPEEVGTLEPAGAQLNGPSAKVLDEHILAPLGFSRADAWLCDMLPEARLNPNQVKVIEEKYDPLVELYGLNPVTVPKRPSAFCDEARCREIAEELRRSEADTVVLLGDLPIRQFLCRICEVPYASLQEYTECCGYGMPDEIELCGKKRKLIALAHPRQIGALGAHSDKWHTMHAEWEKSLSEER